MSSKETVGGRLVVKDVCGELYYGQNYMDADPNDLENMKEIVLNDLKNLKYFSMVDTEGNEVFFHPQHIVSVKLEYT